MSYHLARDRIVFTYEPEPDGWPAAVVTGHDCYEDGSTFFVEHVVVFPNAPAGTLFGLLRAGLAAARDLGFCHLETYVHGAQAARSSLETTARRLGFKRVGEDEDGAYWGRSITVDEGGAGV